MLYRISPRSIGRVPHIYNIQLTNPNTEYSQQLPTGTKKFMISERNGNPFRLAFEPGIVAPGVGAYENILANQPYWEDHVNSQGVPIIPHMAAPVGGRVVEIICWTR